jgi:hypothetical protein
MASYTVKLLDAVDELDNALAEAGVVQNTRVSLAFQAIRDLLDECELPAEAEAPTDVGESALTRPPKG